jgi:hypothetical protein
VAAERAGAASRFEADLAAEPRCEAEWALAREADFPEVRARDGRVDCGKVANLDAREGVCVGFAASSAGQRMAHAITIRAAVAAFRYMLIFGGAEAPEQLLPYLLRRHAISIQAGSVYRSVNTCRLVLVQ